MFTGFLAFVSLTKHNDSVINSLNVVSMNDDDKIELPIKGRAGNRKKVKDPEQLVMMINSHQ